jgi:hypothetical protein
MVNHPNRNTRRQRSPKPDTLFLVVTTPVDNIRDVTTLACDIVDAYGGSFEGAGQWLNGTGIVDRDMSFSFDQRPSKTRDRALRDELAKALPNLEYNWGSDEPPLSQGDQEKCEIGLGPWYLRELVKLVEAGHSDPTSTIHDDPTGILYAVWIYLTEHLLKSGVEEPREFSRQLAYSIQRLQAQN